MRVTAATPSGRPGSAPAAPGAARPAAEGCGSGGPEFAGPGSGALEFSGLGPDRLVSPELASAAASFPGMIDTLRVLQNRITGSVPTEELAAEVSRTLTGLAIRLGAHAVDEQAQISGRMDLPGRAQAMVPVIYLDEQDEQHAAGRVTFGRFYLGGNGAVHGGAIPLVFDDVMGRLANTGGRPRSRTAYLHVSYRSITPIDRELQLTARFDREDGRKRFLSAELRDRGRLCAEAEGLFVALRPGQP
jgi:acyl-coenzyme A thioesterase PaaI-like protein